MAEQEVNPPIAEPTDPIVEHHRVLADWGTTVGIHGQACQGSRISLAKPRPTPSAGKAQSCTQAQSASSQPSSLRRTRKKFLGAWYRLRGWIQTGTISHSSPEEPVPSSISLLSSLKCLNRKVFGSCPILPGFDIGWKSVLVRENLRRAGNGPQTSLRKDY